MSAAVLAAVLLCGCQGGRPSRLDGARTASPQCLVRFSPHGGCTQLVTETLGMAKRTVLMQAYSCTSQPIAEALIAAHRRGVSVDVILDKSQRTERACIAGALIAEGIPVHIDAAHAIAHNKVIVVDDETVVTGSFNFTASAEERNAENLLVVRDQDLAARYRENWREHLAHSQPYGGATQASGRAR